MNEPKISVIIPLYNAEKYIRECLISVLTSKFQDYEVLVVDDCSTDNSVAKVKKLQLHFGGRLKIFSTEKNSGGPGIPRNIGIKNAKGKYITFIDNDDMILPDTLGIFFETAELYDAEVIHTEKCFIFNKEFTREKLRLAHTGIEANKLVDKPTFEPEALDYRMKHFISGEIVFLPWGKFYRRDFLLENQIDFPQMRYGEDCVFTFKCFYLAKKYLLVPYVTNLHRVGISSASNSGHFLRESIQSWLNILLKQTSALHDFMEEQAFFKANPAWLYKVLDFCIKGNFKIMYFQDGIEPHDLFRSLFEELQNPAHNQKGKNIVSAYLYVQRFLTR